MKIGKSGPGLGSPKVKKYNLGKVKVKMGKVGIGEGENLLQRGEKPSCGMNVKIQAEG